MLSRKSPDLGNCPRDLCHRLLLGDPLANQQGVVKNEVKVNVLNQPYGGFPWLDMPQYANENWYNAHNFYGDLADLEAAGVTHNHNGERDGGTTGKKLLGNPRHALTLDSVSNMFSR